MPDLFGHVAQERYPDAPGHKGRDTGIAAAEDVAPKVPRLQRVVLKSLETAGPSTPDEIAARHGLSILTIRPRVSELGRLGKIVDTGARRVNRSGKKAIVWRLAKVAEQNTPDNSPAAPEPGPR